MNPSVRGVVYLGLGLFVGVAVTRHFFTVTRSQVFDLDGNEITDDSELFGGVISLGTEPARVPPIPRAADDTFNIFDLAGIDDAVARFQR